MPGLYGSTPGYGNYAGSEQRNGQTIDKYVVAEAATVPVKQITYTTQAVQVPRTTMETVTRTIQVPKTEMESFEVESKHPKIEMDTRTIQVPKMIMEDQEIQVQVPHKVTVPVQQDGAAHRPRPGHRPGRAGRDGDRDAHHPGPEARSWRTRRSRSPARSTRP